MFHNPKRLRRPEERVGTLTNAALPPPNRTVNIDADHRLVRSLRARDERAFEQLIQRYYPSLLPLAIGFVRGRDEADDVIQETWLAVLTGIDRFQGRSSFKTWLFRILMNRARSRAKREARMVPFSAFGVPQSVTQDAETKPGRFESVAPTWAGARARTPEDHLLAAELREQIESAIAQLPDTQQAVITLRDVDGWNADEVCNALKISETNQRVLLHRARVKVRAALGRYADTRATASTRSA